MPSMTRCESLLTLACVAQVFSHTHTLPQHTHPSYRALGVQVGTPWNGLLAVLRILQSERALSLELVAAIAGCISSTVGDALTPVGTGHNEGSLAWSLGVLRVAGHTLLTQNLLEVLLSFLGMRAQMMSWVRQATEMLLLGGHSSEVRI